MLPAEVQTIEFDAIATGISGDTVEVTCSVQVPRAGWDGAKISLWSANVDSHKLRIDQPFTISGVDRFQRKVIIKGVYFGSWPLYPESRRRAAAIPVINAEELQIVRRLGYKVDTGKISFVLSKNTFINGVPSLNTTVTENSHLEKLFPLELPGLGSAVFSRSWKFWKTSDAAEANSICGYRMDVTLSSPLIGSDILNLTRSFMTVPSIFFRQRISVLGWSVFDEGVESQTWHQPLEPISPDYSGVISNDYLFLPNKILPELSSAMATFGMLEGKYKNLIERIALGLVPYVKQSEPQRFLSMFHALEACRSFAKKNVSPEEAAQTESLLEVLQSAKTGVETGVEKRIEGIIQKIKNGPQTSLATDLTEVLDSWGVYRTDLWPLAGPDKNPGLKNIRDLLAHKGSTAVNTTSLMFANEHLKILLERVVLALLNIPFNRSQISVTRTTNDAFFHPNFVDIHRSQVLASPDWN